MIDTVLKKLYFFTKLSTSLLLFSAIIFFGYVFSKAYISNSGNEQSFLINEQINELFVAVKYNAESLNNIKKQIASNEKSLKDINLKVSQTDNSDIILEQLKKLLEDNEMIVEIRARHGYLDKKESYIRDRGTAFRLTSNDVYDKLFENKITK